MKYLTITCKNCWKSCAAWMRMCVSEFFLTPPYELVVICFVVVVIISLFCCCMCGPVGYVIYIFVTNKAGNVKNKEQVLWKWIWIYIMITYILRLFQLEWNNWYYYSNWNQLQKGRWKLKRIINCRIIDRCKIKECLEAHIPILNE